MGLQLCKACGKLFERKGTQKYCPGPHFKICRCCGEKFECDPRSNKTCCSKACIDKLAQESKKANLGERACKECGKLFIPVQASQIYCKGPHISNCVICGKEFEYTVSPKEKPATCSRECQTKLQAEKSMEKYGVTNVSKSSEVKQKISDANKSTGSGGQKRLHTVQEKYGVDNVAKVPEIIEKQKSIFVAKYGVNNPMKCEYVADKLSAILSDPEHVAAVKRTLLERYGVTATQSIPEVHARTVATNMKKYGVPYYCMTDEYKQGNGHVISKTNLAFSELLKDAGIAHSLEFNVENRSFDFKLEDSQIVIEIDPTYTHNSLGNHWGEGISDKYHRDKSELAKQHGLRCIHVFDWDETDKILNLIQSKDHIYARKCHVQDVSAEDAKQFETAYHIQGSVKGEIIRMGLYQETTLVQLMTFGRPRYTQKYEWELLRLCTISGRYVIGGAAKLWKHFIDAYHPNSVVSYCDTSKFSGDVYLKLGMKLDGINPPNKIWSKGHERVTNNLLLQRGYDQLFGTNFGKGTSNESLMIENGWLPVYDCGQARYVYTA